MTVVSEFVRLGGGTAGTVLTPSIPLAYPQVAHVVSRRLMRRFMQVSAISADGSIPGSSSESGEGRSPLFVSPARSITRKDGSESPLQIDVGVVADVVGHLEDAATGEREAG